MSVEFRFVKNGPQLGLLAVAGLAIFGTQYLESQIVIKGNGREVRVNNPATEVKAAPLMPVLKWNNGESVSGEIVSATPDEITWKTSLFTAR
ncbi:MAG: hypothetical protein WCN98_05335 [Verrucomicrobiaceae bacterium]